MFYAIKLIVKTGMSGLYNFSNTPTPTFVQNFKTDKNGQNKNLDSSI